MLAKCVQTGWQVFLWKTWVTGNIFLKPCLSSIYNICVPFTRYHVAKKLNRLGWTSDTFKLLIHTYCLSKVTTKNWKKTSSYASTLYGHLQCLSFSSAKSALADTSQSSVVLLLNTGWICAPAPPWFVLIWLFKQPAGQLDVFLF